MKSLIRQLLIISVLFMGTEGAWDIGSEAHPHGDSYAHQSDVSNPDTGVQTDADPNPLPDDDGNLCDHLCHGHMSSIALDHSNFSMAGASKFYAFHATMISNRFRAPPTPPPNV